MLGFSFSLGATGLSLLTGVGGISPSPMAAQIASSRGEMMALASTARSEANRKQAARTRHYTAQQSFADLRVCFAGYYVDSATSGNGQIAAEVNAPSTHIIRCNLEIAGQSIPVLFNGVRDGIVPIGDPCYMSDPILPSSFGLTEFAPNTEMYLRAEREFAVGGIPMFHQTSSSTTAIPGERFFAASGTSPSQLDATGDMVVANGWTAQAHLWFPLAFIGTPKRPTMSVITVGASIENGVGDGLGDGLNGSGGYMRRMLADVNGRKIARLHLAKSGETAKSFIANSAKRRHMLQYATHVFSGHGGNDYSTGETLADTEARWTQVWAQVKAVPSIMYVEHYALSPKSTSTDNWATVGNQSPRTGYEIGGAWRDAGNAWCAGQVDSDVNLDGFVNLSDAQVAPSKKDVWRTDLGKPTDDGIHPNKVVADAVARANAAYRGVKGCSRGGVIKHALTLMSFVHRNVGNVAEDI